ncbi:MAG TPA: site-specific integrase [Acidimicrobiales bacterium]|nr:site-specific integrase [Acidimicrobiales bacterium]
MSYSDQQRAVVEALGLSPDDLRGLAGVLESDHVVVSVRQVAATYLATLADQHRYTKSLHRVILWAGNDDAATVQPSDVTGWTRRAGSEARTDAKARHGVGAQEAMILATRAAFAHAIESGLIRHNPACQVPLPDRPPSRRGALSADQLAQVHFALLAHSRDPELDDLVFGFLRETGCRRHGAIRLSHDDLAPATRAVRLVEKYAKQRWVPVSAHLVQRLVSHTALRHDGCNLVLHRRDGGHLNDKWFEGFARRIQNLAWAKELGVSAHWIRHTTITDIERIAGVRVAAAYAGHADSNFGVTGTYTKASPEELRLAHSLLFFDQDDSADEPGITPNLLRRATSSQSSSFRFTDPRGFGGHGAR